MAAKASAERNSKEGESKRAWKTSPLVQIGEDRKCDRPSVTGKVSRPRARGRLLHPPKQRQGEVEDGPPCHQRMREVISRYSSLAPSLPPLSSSVFFTPSAVVIYSIPSAQNERTRRKEEGVRWSGGANGRTDADGGDSTVVCN